METINFIFGCIGVVFAILVPLLALVLYGYGTYTLYEKRDTFGVFYIGTLGLIGVGAAFFMSYGLLSLVFGG